MRNSVTIYGAKSLDRYTKLILSQGFQNNSWETVDGEVGQKSGFNTDTIIYQIHGAPQAAAEDKMIMQMITGISPLRGKAVVLIHRPDEVQESLPELKNVLLKLPSNLGLVFLGDKHIDDSFYRCIDKRFVVPHGFFDVKEVIQKDPIVIGSHTTWGEMRSIEHALRLIVEILKLDRNGSRNIVGYLGGKPNDQLQISHLKKLYEDLFGGNEIKFLNAHEYPLLKIIHDFTKQHVILVDFLNVDPEDFGITFNIQMYYFGNKVRTGESSGSLHASISIPIILEMNGSEITEDLRVIRIPYTSLDDIGTIDFISGAQKIINTIDDASFISMLEHNLLQAKKVNNTFVARSYINIFEQL